MSAATQKSIWSITLGTLAGIEIRVHMSFFLLLGWLVMSGIVAHGEPLLEFWFVLGAVASIALHELAHLIVSRQYGLEARHLMVYPFGAVQEFSGQASPTARMKVAVAGPTCNLLIAGLLLPFAGDMSFLESSVITRLYLFNFWIAACNFIPAYPTDGAQLLRGITFALGMSDPDQTTCRVSQIIAIAIVIAGIMLSEPLLLVAGAFVYWNALQEYFDFTVRKNSHSVSVSDVLVPLNRLDTLTHGTLAREALALALKSAHTFFPVMLGSQLLGILRKDVLIKNVAAHDESTYVSDLMERELPTASLDTTIESLIAQYGTASGTPIAVLSDDEELLGLILKDRLLEALVIGSS